MNSSLILASVEAKLGFIESAVGVKFVAMFLRTSHLKLNPSDMAYFGGNNIGSGFSEIGVMNSKKAMSSFFEARFCSC